MTIKDAVMADTHPIIRTLFGCLEYAMAGLH